jgi:hypothetical protein
MAPACSNPLRGRGSGEQPASRNTGRERPSLVGLSGALAGLLSVSRANQAAAFDKISRTSRGFPRRSRVSSSRSAGVRLCLTWPRSRFAHATQFLIDCAFGPKSLCELRRRATRMIQLEHLLTEFRGTGSSRFIPHSGQLHSGVLQTGSTPSGPFGEGPTRAPIYCHPRRHALVRCSQPAGFGDYCTAARAFARARRSLTAH